MSNLLNLPQFPAGTTIALVSNCDWNDSVYVPQPGYASALIQVLGALAESAPHLSGLTTAPSVTPEMQATGPGVPPGVTVETVTVNSITLSEAPSLSAPAVTLSFYAPPLDLTGISFLSTLRQSALSAAPILQMSTQAGTMSNGGTSGTFGWNVPAALMLKAPFPSELAAQGTISCVLDIVATDATGAKVNLCAENGPIPVTVSLSVTR